MLQRHLIRLLTTQHKKGKCRIISTLKAYKKKWSRYIIFYIYSRLMEETWHWRKVQSSVHVYRRKLISNIYSVLYLTSWRRNDRSLPLDVQCREIIAPDYTPASYNADMDASEVVQTREEKWKASRRRRGVVVSRRLSRPVSRTIVDY